MTLASLVGRGETRGRRRIRGRQWAALGFLAPAIVFVVVLFGYPIAYNISMSLRDYTIRSFYTGQAPFAGVGNYRAVFRDPVFAEALLHTALFTVCSIVCQFAIGLALAVFFTRHFPLGRLLRALLLLPWLLPLVVSGAVWRWMLDQDDGVINAVLEALHLAGRTGVPWLTSTHWALSALVLANVWIGIPFNLVLLHSGLQDIPATLYEAAALDGCGAWRRFRHITWPLLRPVTAVVLMLGLVYTLKVFDVVQVISGGGPADATQVLTTWSYHLSFANFEFGQGAAVGNVLILIATVFGLVYLRSARGSMVSA